MTNSLPPSQDLSHALGLDTLTNIERQDFLDDVGSVIIESAVLNFMLTLNDSEHAAVQNFVESVGSGEQVLEGLATRYPTFLEILETEIAHFRNEAAVVLESEGK